MLKIGKLKLRLKTILAPMAGVSDLPFRMLNREFGSELAFCEMLNVRSISYKSKKTQQMLSSDPKDRPLGIQLLGAEPKFILKALDVLKKYPFDILDFNAACPVKKVIRRGEGASLLKEPKKLNRLLKLLVENCRVPVTVKIRTGWSEESVNAEEVARYAEDSGIKGLFIHGRTKTQEYHGPIDYQVICKVKRVLKIPVIASGNILSGQLAKKMFDETGCDGVLIARGALGNPWIFRETCEFLKSGLIIKKPQRLEVIEVMLKHLYKIIDFYGERIGVVVFRKFFSWYTRGFPRVRLMRERISRLKTKEDLIHTIEEYRLNEMLLTSKDTAIP